VTDAPTFADLRRFFAPQRVALIGATEDLSKFGGRCLRQMLDFGFAGEIFPINPNRTEVFGRPCYPSLAALPAAPDHVGIVLPAARCAAELAECGRLGVPFATVFSAGFAEMGEAAGAALQAELVRTARAGGVRFMGPNCNGLVSFADGFAMTSTATITGPRRPAGDIGVVSQSGGAGQVNVMWRAQELGLGISHQVSSGNDADLDMCDYMAFMVEDPRTRVVLAIAERAPDGARLRAVATRAAELGKPIVMVKVGRTEAGSRAAASHTGAVTGADAVFDAALRQLGVLRVEDAHELYETAMLLRQRKHPAGRGAAALSISGGNLVLLADLGAARGIGFPEYADTTREALRRLVPGFVGVRNPTDMSAGAIGQKDIFARAAHAIAEDPAIDALIPVITFAPAADIRPIAALAAVSPKPMPILWTGKCSDDPALTPAALIAEGHAVYRDALPCVTALRRAMQYGAFQARRAGAEMPRRPDGIDPASALHLLKAGGATLSEPESKAVAVCYGLAPPRETLATTADEAAAAASSVGGPVALKIQSPDIPHKTEAGGVRLGLSGDAAVRQGFAALLASARAFAPAACIDGVLVQEMVTGGVEMLLGASCDPNFGRVLAVGFGGIHVEILRDVAFRLPPITAAEAREMLEELRLFPLLLGARGRPRADMTALCAAVERFSWLAHDLGKHVAEIDINPLVVLPEGRGVRMLDALIVRSAPDEA
jgi:acetate---CoA ligase (ADP-forming)